MRMMKISLGLVTLTAGIAVAQEVKMQEPRSFHNAGIALAVPEGFVPQQPAEKFDVMRSVLDSGKKSAFAVSLKAFPAAPKDTAESFASATIPDLQKNLVIRHFKVLKRTQMRIADINGSARLVSFTFRGQERIATQVFFIRDIKSSSRSIRLCYVLTLEGAPAQRARVLTFFGLVTKSLSLIPLRHPIDTGVKELSEPLKVYKRDFSIRPPRDWYVNVVDNVVDMGLTDYLSDEHLSPMVRVNVTDLQTFESPQDCCKEHLAFARKKTEGLNYETKIVSEGPAKLGGMEGYQLVLLQTMKKASVGGDRGCAIIIDRTVCIRLAAGQNRSVSLLMIAEGGKDKINAGQEIFNRIAESFSFLKPPGGPETKPATKPASAPATMPADKK